MKISVRELGTGGMAHQLRALGVLSKDLDLVLRTHIEAQEIQCPLLALCMQGTDIHKQNTHKHTDKMR